MLTGLGHDTLICCDHHCHQINACGSGHHVSDKFLMTRNIHNADMPSGGQIQKRETQFYGNAPKLFLFEPVSVNAGQGFDERGLAMINMSCCSQDNLF